jgi:hypothetical protein
MTVIELPDDQAEALKARAAAEGLTLGEWLAELAGTETILPENDPERPLLSAANIVLNRMRNVPPEIMAAMPKDGASEHDHYIYGWPKKNE